MKYAVKQFSPGYNVHNKLLFMPEQKTPTRIPKLAWHLVGAVITITPPPMTLLYEIFSYKFNPYLITE
jgi:hypothetical protein